MQNERDVVADVLRQEPLTRAVDPTEVTQQKEKMDQLIHNPEAFDQAVKNMGRYNTRIPDDSKVAEPKPIICDGCNVNPPHEHRCHGGSRITVRGEFMDANCECEPCNMRPTQESLSAWAEAGYPADFKFKY